MANDFDLSGFITFVDSTILDAVNDMEALEVAMKIALCREANRRPKEPAPFSLSAPAAICRQDAFVLRL